MIRSWFNSLLRFSFRAWYWLHGNVHRYFLDHIRVRGTVRVQINNLNLRMHSQGDDGIVDALYFTEDRYGEYEEVNLFRTLAQKSDTIFDIGANTGLYSIVSKLSNPKAHVVAFEPYGPNIDRLKRNAGLNELNDQIEIVQMAVGDDNNKTDFAVPGGGGISDVLSADIQFTEQFSEKKDDYKTVQVPQMTLDAYVAKMKKPGVDLIKIDVENYELSVFKGALDVLKNFRPVILVELFVDRERIEFFKSHLQPIGYHCYLVGKKGLFRTDELVENPDCRNYLFSTQRSETPYLSYTDLPQLVTAISGHEG